MHGIKLALSLLLALVLLTPVTFAEKRNLTNEEWLLSLEKRTLLKFITECALRKDQILSIKEEGLTFEYYGNLGVAPSWDGYPSSLSVIEQRWVSACVLARVNYFGTPVPINLRTDMDSGFFIPVTDNELDAFPFYEGAFFGNIFETSQKKYVCQGDAPKNVLVDRNRLCSLPAMGNESSKVSACGYIIVGSCDDKTVFIRDGINYQETFHVWLKMH